MLMFYAPEQTCIKLVAAINDAKTQADHDKAKHIAQGYQQRLKETNIAWPCCALDFHFEDGDRPMCCGECLDWEPAGPKQKYVSWPTVHIVDYYRGLKLFYFLGESRRGKYNMWFQTHCALDLGGCLDSGLA